MEKEKNYFVLSLPLKLEPWQEHRLDKALEVNRQIYNAMLREGLKRYRQMAQTRAFRTLREELKTSRDPAKRKRIYRELDGLKERYRLRPYDFSKDSTAYRRHFKENTDAPIVQNLAVNVSRAIQGLSDGRSEKVFFKPESGLDCISGKTNHTSIRYQDGFLYWKKLRLKTLEKGNAYERQALESTICFCRIKRRLIRGKFRYYAELVLKGSCPVRKTIPVRRKGTVGIKSSLSALTAVSAGEILKQKLPRSSDTLEAQRKALARKLERSRRANNPQNYEKNGTVRKGIFLWHQSINYRNLIKQYAEILRMQRVRREELQRACMEQLLEMGDTFIYEELPYRSMKYGGRKIEDAAPAAFFQKFRRKAENQGRLCLAANPLQTRSSSFDHSTGTAQKAKPPLPQAIRVIEGQEIDSQCYGAFLLRHLNPESGQIDTDSCRQEFPQFLELYQSYELRHAV